MTNTTETTITITAEQIAEIRKWMENIDAWACEAHKQNDRNSETAYESMAQGIEKACEIFGIEF